MNGLTGQTRVFYNDQSVFGSLYLVIKERHGLFRDAAMLGLLDTVRAKSLSFFTATPGLRFLSLTGELHVVGVKTSVESRVMIVTFPRSVLQKFPFKNTTIAEKYSLGTQSM